MKTIEEAKDDCILDCGCLNYRESDYTAGYAGGVDYGFEAGVEFAQRWISVEDELPEKREREYQIVAKTDNIGSAMYGIIFTKWIKDESSLNSIKNYFTHWRPIEHK